MACCNNWMVAEVVVAARAFGRQVALAMVVEGVEAAPCSVWLTTTTGDDCTHCVTVLLPTEWLLRRCWPGRDAC